MYLTNIQIERIAIDLTHKIADRLGFNDKDDITRAHQDMELIQQEITSYLSNLFL